MNKYIIMTCFFLSSLLEMYSQTNSREGYWHSNKDTIRIFLVFAEVFNGPSVPVSSRWLPGQMPDNPEKYLDAFLDEDNIHGWVTNYFYQASFGKYVVLGDYYPDVVSIDYNHFSGSGDVDVMSYLDNLPDSIIYTANGLTFNSGDFDKWNMPLGIGRKNSRGSNGMIDELAIVWRNHPYLSNGTGSANHSTYTSVKNKQGFIGRLRLESNDASHEYNIRHEFAHHIFGSNAMHASQTSGGPQAFLSPTLGYSILSGSHSISHEAFNAFDRYRLGWKHPKKMHLISVGEGGNEIATDFDYDNNLPADEEYILRDFVSTGDVIRIKLPYLQTENSATLDQWLWIENRQKMDGNFDVKGKSKKGMYAFIQVGKDDTTDFYGVNSLRGYLHFLQAFGNYDIDVEFGYLAGNNGAAACAFHINTNNPNPLTGSSMVSFQGNNHIDPNYTTSGEHYDKIFLQEMLMPNLLTIDGSVVSKESFNYTRDDPDDTYNEGVDYFANPWAGSVFDGFSEGEKIGIDCNPPSTPVLMRQTKASTNYAPYPTPEPSDNIKIYLNGLSIEFVEQFFNGDIKVRVRKYDHEINNNVRWCGDIVLHEKIYIKTGKQVLLDQGLTPTRPVNPIVFNGEKIFSSPTVLTAKPHSRVYVEENAQLMIEDNSTLVLDSGSYLLTEEDSEVRVKTGGSLVLREGSNLEVWNGGKVIIEDGAYFCIEQGAKVYLEDFNSVINMHPQAMQAVNEEAYPENCNCLSNIFINPVSGDGSINILSGYVYIQNENISSDRYVGAAKIYIGRNVTTSKPSGDVFIQNNSTLILNASEEVLLDGGTEVQLGSELIIENEIQ